MLAVWGHHYLQAEQLVAAATLLGRGLTEGSADCGASPDSPLKTQQNWFPERAEREEAWWTQGDEATDGHVSTACPQRVSALAETAIDPISATV